MGNGPKEGVIDKNHEVFKYPGLYICDGSVIPENLAVNPSLTITALSERFCSNFPRNPNCGMDFIEPEVKFSSDKERS